MKKLLIILMLTCPFVANAAYTECKLLRTDGVILFGHCDSKDGVTIFNSCIQTMCQVNPALVHALESSDPSICKDKIDILKGVLLAKQVKTLAEVPFCEKGK